LLTSAAPRVGATVPRVPCRPSPGPVRLAEYAHPRTGKRTKIRQAIASRPGRRGGLALLEQASDEGGSAGRTLVVVRAKEMLPQVYPRATLDASRRIRARGLEAWVLRVLADIASRSATPDFEKAQGLYREALDLADMLGMRPLVAHCHLGLGKLYRRTGKQQEAKEHFATATTMYREMGMTYWLEKAEPELARASG